MANRERQRQQQMRFWRSVFLAICYFNLLSVASPQATSGESKTLVTALSLRVLQENAYKSAGRLDSQLEHLGGLTIINGFVIDEKSHDIILYGVNDPALPPLNVDDFVIAMRNIWLRYARLEGNTYYYASPGCSIDPDPSVLQKLDVIGAQIGQSKSADENEQTLQLWQKTANAPQKVSVLGIPFNSRFAQTMVEADYAMKTLADGSDIPLHANLTSMTDRSMEVVKADLAAGRPLSVNATMMNRFWFCADKTSFRGGPGIIAIEKCPVILLTEKEFLKKGSPVGTGGTDELAAAFASQFSSNYTSIAHERVVYAELQSLFRFVALASLLKSENASEQSHLDLSAYLERLALPAPILGPTLSGRSNIKEIESRKEQGNGYSITTVWLCSCGGVDMQMNVDRNSIQKDSSGDLATFKEMLLRSRPSVGALSWVVK